MLCGSCMGGGGSLPDVPGLKGRDATRFITWEGIALLVNGLLVIMRALEGDCCTTILGGQHLPGESTACHCSGYREVRTTDADH